MKTLALLSVFFLPLSFACGSGSRPTSSGPQGPTEASGTKSQARALLDKAKAELRGNPRSAFWHNQAAVAYAMLGDYKSAQELMKEAISIEPGNPIHWMGLSAILKELGDQQGEVSALKRTLEL